MNRVASHSTNSPPPSIGVSNRTGHLPCGYLLPKTISRTCRARAISRQSKWSSRDLKCLPPHILAVFGVLAVISAVCRHPEFLLPAFRVLAVVPSNARDQVA